MIRYKIPVVSKISAKTNINKKQERQKQTVIYCLSVNKCMKMIIFIEKKKNKKKNIILKGNKLLVIIAGKNTFFHGMVMRNKELTARILQCKQN